MAVTETLCRVSDGRDADRLDGEPQAHAPWPADPKLRRDGFQVVIDRAALAELHSHGISQQEVEVCGVLAGELCCDDRGPYLHIQAIVRGSAASSRSAQVTFTAETWTAVQQTMETQHAEKRMTGWYHTHPNFGVFLSDMDLFIHDNFFNLPWQIAWVYDPVREEDGLFVWKDGKMVRQSFILHVEDASSGDAGDMEVNPPENPEQPHSAELQSEMAERLKKLEHQLQWTRVLLALVGVIALIWPLWLTYAMPRPRQSSFAFPSEHLPNSAQAAPTTQP